MSDLDVLNLAQSIEPDPTRVAAWYRSEPIMTLGGLTQWQIVRAGHIGALVDFLRVIQIEVSESGSHAKKSWRLAAISDFNANRWVTRSLIGMCTRILGHARRNVTSTGTTWLHPITSGALMINSPCGARYSPAAVRSTSSMSSMICRHEATRVYRRQRNGHGFEPVHGLSPVKGCLPNLPSSALIRKVLAFPSIRSPHE